MLQSGCSWYRHDYVQERVKKQNKYPKNSGPKNYGENTNFSADRVTSYKEEVFNFQFHTTTTQKKRINKNPQTVMMENGIKLKLWPPRRNKACTDRSECEIEIFQPSAFKLEIKRAAPQEPSPNGATHKPAETTTENEKVDDDSESTGLSERKRKSEGLPPFRRREKWTPLSPGRLCSISNKFIKACNGLHGGGMFMRWISVSPRGRVYIIMIN